MDIQRENKLSQRGGIRLRDYTRGQPMPEQSGLGKINFDKVGRSLIYASLGLGLLELLMPKRMQKIAGVRRGNYSGLIRLIGLRELMSAVMIFMQPRPINGVWARVLGDGMDLAVLGAAFTQPKVKKNSLSAVTAFIAGTAALDALTALQLNKRKAEAKGVSVMTQQDLDSRTKGGSFHVMRSITINRPVEELYQFWHNFENLPKFMYHLEMVSVIDQRRSHWVAKAPAGSHVEWDAEITQDRPNQMIAWQSTPNADVTNSGVVRFDPAPGDRGTVVRVEIDYSPPGGPIGKLVAQLFGEDPSQQVTADLARFKQVMETGEVLRSDGTPLGVGSKAIMHPAQPARDAKTMKNKQFEKYDQRTTHPAEQQQQQHENMGM